MDFPRFSRLVEHAVGSPLAFAAAIFVILLWAATGPLFNYSDTWQLVVNTATTIITFLMVFLIQNTQTRDTAAIHLKLDELIRVNKDARDDLIDAENMTTKHVEQIQRDMRPPQDRRPTDG